MYFRRVEPDEDGRQQQQQQQQQQGQQTDLGTVHRQQQMESSGTNEKQTVSKARNWLLISLTAVRIFQLVCFAFAHLVFLALIYEAELWLEDPRDKESYQANIPWTRLLVRFYAVSPLRNPLHANKRSEFCELDISRICPGPHLLVAKYRSQAMAVLRHYHLHW